MIFEFFEKLKILDTEVKFFPFPQIDNAILPIEEMIALPMD
jgi:hypothetical protein